MTLIEESNDTTMEVISYLNNGDLGIPKPEKKKKHDRSSVELTLNHCSETNMPNMSIEEFNESMVKKKKLKRSEINGTLFKNKNFVNDEYKKPKKHRNSLSSTSNYNVYPHISKNLVEEFSENMVKKKKRKINEIVDTTLESNSYINNKDIITQKSKKKKNHDRNSVASTSNYNEDLCASMSTVEKSHDNTLEGNNYLSNEDLEIQKSKKKKKHDRKSMEHIFNSNTDINISKKWMEELNENTIKQKKPKSIIIDTSFESISNVNDEDRNIHKSKKMKNQDRSSVDAISMNSTNPTSLNFCEKYNDSLVKKNISKINEVAVTPLKSISNVNDKDIITQISKKKKKRDRSSVDFTPDYSEDLCASMSTVEKSHDNTLEGNNYPSNEVLEIQKSKKKKKHDRKSMEHIFNSNTDINISKKWMEELNENTIKQKKPKSIIIDTSFESISNVNDEDRNSHKSKKMKNQDRSSIDAISNNRINPYTSQNPCDESNENLVKKKECKINEIAVATLESNSYINDEDKNIQKTQKKKNHDRNSIDTISNNRIDPYISENLCEESKENLVKKIKMNETVVTTLESNSYVNNGDIITQKSKKKKKHKRSSVASTSNYSEDLWASMSPVKKSPDNTLERNNYLSNEDLEIQKSKKKKNHDRSSIDVISIDSTDPSTSQNFCEKYHDSSVKKSISKINKMTVTSLKSISSVNDESGNIQKFKKMKNDNRSSIDAISNNRIDPCISQNLCEESNENSVKNIKTNETAVTTLESNSYVYDESIITQKSKKKKNHDRNSVASTSNYNEDLCASMSTVEKSHDNTLEGNNYLSNEDLEIQKSKKKKKHDRKSMEHIFNSNTDINISKKWMEELNENTIKQKKPKSIIIDTSFESISKVNDEDRNIHKSKKMKNQDRSSVDAISMNSTDPSTSLNFCEEFDDSSVKKNKRKINEITDTILESISYVNDEHKNIEKYKKIKNQDKSSIDAISNNYTDSNISMDLVEESNDRDDKTDVSKNIKSSKQYLIEPLNVDETFNKSSKSMNNSTSNENNLHIKLEYGSDFINQNPQEKKVIEDILQAINLFKLENPSTTEDKVILGEYNLIDHILKSNPSIYNHKDSKFLQSTFSMFMKSSINIEGQVVTQSDIILLKSIGKHILEKITDAYDKSKIIENDLHIELPAKCQNNKIHYIETALISQLDKEKMNLINQLNPAFKSGRFSKEEDNMIHKYWSKFKQEYNISDPGPFLSIRGRGLMKLTLPTKIKLQFIRYISAELPNRLLSSVYHRFNVLYRKLVNKISFSEEEDEIIMIVDSCEAIKNKFAVLSFLLNRYRELIYKRKISLKMKPLRGSYIFWDINKLQKLFETVLLETKTEDWNDLKDIKIKRETWKKISKHFDENINYEKCQTQWNFLKTRLFCKTPIKYSTFKVIVLELLLEINPRNWADLNWIEITNKLYPGASSKVINTIFHWWITRKVPKELRQDVRLTLKYLEANCLDSEKEKVETGKENELSRLTVEDENVLVEFK